MGDTKYTIPENAGINDNDTLVQVISSAIKIPGVRVNREAFLLTQFKDVDAEMREAIVEKGTIEAGCSRESLRKRAAKLLGERVLASTGASFLAGLPGGLAMAAAIPADMLQYYAVALRAAQEIAYLYGEDDIWKDGTVDDDKVRGQLILYFGVMLGASGAAQAVRVFTATLAREALKQIPKQALTKTIYYPIIKSIAKAVGVKMTKGLFAKGVSKVIPVIGGVISGGITFASMRPMGMRLIDSLDEAHFNYSQEKFKADWEVVVEECENQEQAAAQDSSVNAESENTVQNECDGQHSDHSSEVVSAGNVLEEIKKAKELLDAGILTEDEFKEMKAKLISRM